MRLAPDYIQFYPTLQCNRSCDFCFNRSLPRVRDTSFEDFSKLLDKITRLSVSSLDIIGGEPTLHPDLLRFVQEADRCRLRVNVSSNGTNISVLSKIQEMGNNGCIGVSINDFDMLNHLKKYIQQNKPVVKMVYGKTADPGLIADILMLKPAKFYLIYRDVMDFGELHTAIPFYEFLSAANRWEAKDSHVGAVFCSGFLPETQTYPELAEVRCAAGTTKLGILPDGSAYPCNLFFGRKEFLLGNILEDSFESIWNHRSLDFFRTFANNRCPHHKCNLHAQCHGGCPAHALKLAGDINARDPRCS
jgi:radical SAM protein with 4Fe4S-binding SPASM domain